jgi:SAM-dependent methyltransferase
VPGELYPVGRCRRCSHVYLVERPSPAEIGRYYPSDYGPHQHRERPERGGRTADRHRLLRRAPPFDILDAGCGAGYDLRPFKARGCGVFGIEADPRAAEEARREGVDVQCCPIEAAAFPDARFDVITMNHALEHVFDPRAALANLRRMLRPDGILYLLFPTADGLWFRVFGRDWYNLDVPRHLHFFGHRSFLRLARETGFRVLHRATRSGGKGFYRSLANAGTRCAFARLAHALSRYGPGRPVTRAILSFVVDGLRQGDVAEYVLAPATRGIGGDPSTSGSSPRP